MEAESCPLVVLGAPGPAGLALEGALVVAVLGAGVSEVAGGAEDCGNDACPAVG